MFNKCVLLGCLLAVNLLIAALPSATAEPFRPERPTRFNSEAELRDYVEKLKMWYQDSSRSNRFGKRVFMPANYKMYNKENERDWNTDYDYLEDSWN